MTAGARSRSSALLSSAASSFIAARTRTHSARTAATSAFAFAFPSPATATATLSTPWTCRRCLIQGRQLHSLKRLSTQSQQRQANFATAAASSASTAGSGPSKPRRTLRYVIAGGTLLGAFVYSDELAHAYAAAARSGRVAVALAICINDYRKTLKEYDTLEDPEAKSKLIKACHKRCAERTRRVMEQNGSIFIKLGQHLSSMNYLLPLEWTTTFIPLQDRCPVSSYEAIEAMFEQDTGRKIEDVFSSFAREPIGAASLAQVHIGVLKETGQKVAVKLQHPALDEWVPLDCALTRTTFAVLKKVFPEYDLEWLSREMDLSLPQELDFAREGRNAQRTAKYFRENTDAPLVIPRVISSQRRILIMDYVAGSRIDDLEYLDRNGIDRDEVSAALARIFNEMIFGHGAYLHCDPHGGNIAIRKNETRKGANFDIILYDHGLYREMPLDLQRSYAKLWLAVLDGDEPRMRRYAYETAGVKDGDFRLFASAITGRDYLTATRGVVSPRTSEEKEKISAKFSDGLLQDLVILLGKMPRIILLILKTNDLTRCLDESLHTRHGPLRTFLILARYATVTVFDEQMQKIREAGSLLHPRNLARFVQAWWRYLRVELKLELYEKYLSLRGRLGVTKAL